MSDTTPTPDLDDLLRRVDEACERSRANLSKDCEPDLSNAMSTLRQGAGGFGTHQLRSGECRQVVEWIDDLGTDSDALRTLLPALASAARSERDARVELDEQLGLQIERRKQAERERDAARQERDAALTRAETAERDRKVTRRHLDETTAALMYKYTGEDGGQPEFLADIIRRAKGRDEARRALAVVERGIYPVPDHEGGFVLDCSEADEPESDALYDADRTDGAFPTARAALLAGADALDKGCPGWDRDAGEGNEP